MSEYFIVNPFIKCPKLWLLYWSFPLSYNLHCTHTYLICLIIHRLYLRGHLVFLDKPLTLLSIRNKVCMSMPYNFESWFASLRTYMSSFNSWKVFTVLLKDNVVFTWVLLNHVVCESIEQHAVVCTYSSVVSALLEDHNLWAYSSEVLELHHQLQHILDQPTLYTLKLNASEHDIGFEQYRKYIQLIR